MMPFHIFTRALVAVLLFLPAVLAQASAQTSAYPDFFERLGATVAIPVDPSTHLQELPMGEGEAGEEQMFIEKFDANSLFEVAVFKATNRIIKGVSYSSHRGGSLNNEQLDAIRSAFTARYGNANTVERSLLVKGVLAEVECQMWESANEKAYLFSVSSVDETRVVIFQKPFLEDKDFFILPEDEPDQPE